MLMHLLVISLSSPARFSDEIGTDEPFGKYSGRKRDFYKIFLSGYLCESIGIIFLYIAL
jgi:hypothetical protein